jgi:hypothetical protein
MPRRTPAEVIKEYGVIIIAIASGTTNIAQVKLNNDKEIRIKELEKQPTPASASSPASPSTPKPPIGEPNPQDPKKPGTGSPSSEQQVMRISTNVNMSLPLDNKALPDCDMWQMKYVLSDNKNNKPVRLEPPVVLDKQIALLNCTIEMPAPNLRLRSLQISGLKNNIAEISWTLPPNPKTGSVSEIDIASTLKLIREKK